MFDNKWSVAVVALMMGFALVKFSAVIDEMSDGLNNRSLQINPVPVSHMIDRAERRLDREFPALR